MTFWSFIAENPVLAWAVLISSFCGFVHLCSHGVTINIIHHQRIAHENTRTGTGTVRGE